MSFGIIDLNVIPVRLKDNAKSEMISQFFFGETLTIIDRSEKWSYVENNLDKYKGWIRNLHFKPITKNQNVEIELQKKIFSSTEIKLTKNNNTIEVPTGSLISSSEFLGYKNEGLNSNIKFEKTAKGFLNSPYLWGGKTKNGIDCSGLVQSIYKTINKILPRDAKNQSKIGNVVNKNFVIGDLAFFGNSKENIKHVGIILNKNEIIHSYGRVRIDKFNEDGIFNYEENRITHKLQVIKRVS